MKELTKLEYFASQAMIGFIMRGPGTFSSGEMNLSKAIAAASVHIAKELIRELNKTEEQDEIPRASTR